ncbi:MAG: hypothetical protein J6V99_05730 [Neisseriaceae bacterium]|nr:hypothetical protein [Neisseriaceae bacterium]
MFINGCALCKPYGLLVGWEAHPTATKNGNAKKLSGSPYRHCEPCRKHGVAISKNYF